MIRRWSWNVCFVFCDIEPLHLQINLQSTLLTFTWRSLAFRSPSSEVLIVEVHLMSTKMGYEDATIDDVLGSRRRRCQIREMARAGEERGDRCKRVDGNESFKGKDIGGIYRLS